MTTDTNTVDKTQATLNKTEQEFEKNASKNEKDMLKKLQAMKKVMIHIPDDPQNPKDKVVPIGINGIVYTVPRGIAVEVPEAIAEIWNDSYKRTKEVNERIEESTSTKIDIM